MSSKELSIKVENISKCYRIGIKDQIHDSIGASILSFIKSPLNNYRKYRSLYKFNDIEYENHKGPKTNHDEIVEFSGIEKFIDTPVKRYSTGMNVRLAFAVAAYLEPDILHFV